MPVLLEQKVVVGPQIQIKFARTALLIIRPDSEVELQDPTYTVKLTHLMFSERIRLECLIHIFFKEMTST